VDIKGKELGTPVWNLLGGRCRDGLLVYSHASGRSVDQTIEQVHTLIAAGYRAVRVQCLVPGLGNVRRPRADGAGDGKGLPFVENDWSSQAYLRFVPTLFAAVRDAVGPKPALLHDAHHRLTPTQAGWLGKRLEDFQLFWLEDAVPAEWQDGYKILRTIRPRRWPWARFSTLFSTATGWYATAGSTT